MMVAAGSKQRAEDQKTMLWVHAVHLGLREEEREEIP